MLIHLAIKNFAVVKQLDLNLEQGLTAITGETGAGKSIAIDALSLCLGERADASCVRKGSAKSEITAHFSIAQSAGAKAWLDDNELAADEDVNTCFIRRVISSEGRSKAFINGTAASLGQLKALGAHILSIYGQNMHLRLLKESEQMRLLDDYAGHAELSQNVRQSFQAWKQKQNELQTLADAQQTNKDRQQLLAYQVKELDEFALAEGEFENLEAQHKKLAHSQHLLDETRESVYALYEAENSAVMTVLRQYKDRLASLTEHDPQLNPVVEMLEESAIQIDEAVQELRGYVDNIENDPEQLSYVESRFSQAIDLARKHQVTPETLYTHHSNIASELANLTSDENRLANLEEEVETAYQHYLELARALSDSRKQASVPLSAEIMQYVHQMNMPDAQMRFDIEFNEDSPATSHGLDKVCIQVATNSGQAFGKLDKVVSGGELSRIGLAMQVVARASNPIPTLIFDEVDTGISGPTASVVGQLLRKLGNEQQVMCVTHLPQVAAQAHNQLYVSKHSDDNETITQVMPLTPQDRIHELARLLGGDKVTESAIANAKELLAQVTE